MPHALPLPSEVLRMFARVLIQRLLTLLLAAPGASSNPLVATIGSSSGNVTGIIPGNTIITYTSPAACVSTASFTVNTASAPITGPNGVCAGSSITLSDTTTGGVWSSSNTSLATVGTGSGIVTGVANGTPTISYSAPGSCVATKSIVVGSNAGGITRTFERMCWFINYTDRQHSRWLME